jgi:flagellar basal-body rod modification protein FlgD
VSIEAVNNSYLSELPGAGPPDTPSQELDEQDFLNLLMTQLQNQDPLSPMEGTQMMEQISALNQVEQLQAANANLESLILGMASLNNASAVNLIDRSVMVAGDEFQAESGSVDLGYLLDGEADSVTIEIFDEAGDSVESIELGEAEAGLNNFTWSGAEAGASYSFSVKATFEDGEVASQAAITGQVTGLDFSAGIVQLVVGDLTIGLDQVLAVLPAQNAAQSELLAQLLGGDDAAPVVPAGPIEEND